MGPDLTSAFQPVREAAAGLPEVTEGAWFGTPCLKVRGKSFVRLKDADTLVLLCPLEEKELLLEMQPAVFFEADHYRGWPAVLARLASIDPATLRHRLAVAWRQKAPKRLIAASHRSWPLTSEVIAAAPRRRHFPDDGFSTDPAAARCPAPSSGCDGRSAHGRA